MRAVIFDFDGTIADSFTAVIGIAYRLTKREQLADVNRAVMMRDSNMGLRQAIRDLEIPRWQWPWLLKRGRKIMSREIHQIPLFPGMEATLKQLHDQKFELFIITSNSRSNAERFLIEKGILQYFKKVYGGVGLFDKSKVIKRVLKDNRLNPSEAVYVGDEVRDIEAARSIEMPIVAVTWGYNSEKLLVDHSPTVVVRSPEQLASVVVEWGNTI